MSFLPADVIGIVATFLTPTTEVQKALMLVNHTWLQGVSCQDGASLKPDIQWPLPALHERDPAVLRLGKGGTDEDIVQLVREMPLVKSLHLDEADISDAVGLAHIGKLKLLTSLKIYFKSRHMMWTNTGPRSMSIYPPVSNEGVKHLGNLQHLESLWLRNADEITELPIEQLEALTSLDIDDCCNITDAILSPAAKLQRLSTLHMVRTKVTDAGLAHLRNMKTLTALRLNECSSSTPLMEAIGELTNLTCLELYDPNPCRLPDGEGWAHLGKLKQLKILEAPLINDDDLALIVENTTNLTSLDMYGSHDVSADGIAELKKLKSLRSLFLTDCQLDDDHLEHIGELVNLTELNLDGCCGITPGFQHLANLKNLTKLHLEGCEIYDEIIKIIVASFPNLTYLVLGETGIDDESVELLKTMNRMKEVDLCQV